LGSCVEGTFFLCSSPMTVNKSSTMSWIQHKEAGKKHFRQENYDQALSSYRSAVLNAPEAEKQILLSNIVACRLKIGGPAMAEAAVEESKQVRLQLVVLRERYVVEECNLLLLILKLPSLTSILCCIHLTVCCH